MPKTIPKTVKETKTFRKDIKRLQKRRKDMDKLYIIVEKLATDTPLSTT